MLNLKNKAAYLSAQATAFCSSWALYIFLNWKIYTFFSIDSLAIYAVVSGLPALLLMNVGGILADKCNRKWGLVVFQALAVFIDLLLLMLLINNQLTLSWMLGYGFVIGVLGALSRPFNQAILLEIIDKEDVPRILGFNSVLFNLCRIFVPILAGGLLLSDTHLVGASLILSLASLVFYSLLSCKVTDYQSERSSFGVLFREQKDILLQYPQLMYIFFMAMIVSMTVGSYTFLIPALNDVFHQGAPSSLSYLYAISGIGSLSAGILKISNKINIKINLIPALGVIASVSMLILIYQNHFYVEAFAFYILALSILLTFISASQSVYEIAPLKAQGRLLSMLGMAIIGIAPLSNGMTGLAVSLWGLQAVFIAYALICGVSCFALLFKMRREAIAQV